MPRRVQPGGDPGDAGGVLYYIYLLNPVSHASRAPYDILTALLPTAVVAGVVYAAVTLPVVKPAGKSGY